MKKQFWIDAILYFAATAFICFAILGESQEFVYSHKDIPPFKYFFWDVGKLYYSIPVIIFSALGFSFLLGKAVPFVRKSFSTPIKYWCIYQGAAFGISTSIVAWHLINYHMFQPAFIFRADFIVMSMVIGTGMYQFDIIARSTKLKASENTILSEKPIQSFEEDLINVGNIVEEIVAAIEGCLRANRKLIAIYGPNGIGKTSAINLSLKKLDQKKIFITEFEPYKYGSELEMVRNFFSQMLKPLDDRYILPGANTLSSKLTRILYGVSGKTPIIPFDIGKLVDFFSDSPDLYGLKEIIEQYLLNLDKKIVVLVDDIDRCSVRKRRIFFQLVSAINSLTNILIIISASAEDLLNNKEPELISIID
jgi:hypothetical protein